MGAPRLGINPYNWWAEGLHGLANRGVAFEAPGSGEWDSATSFPQPILFAAAFDDDLVTKIGDVISTETRAFNADGRVGLNLYVSRLYPLFSRHFNLQYHLTSIDSQHQQLQGPSVGPRSGNPWRRSLPRSELQSRHPRGSRASGRRLQEGHCHLQALRGQRFRELWRRHPAQF